MTIRYFKGEVRASDSIIEQEKNLSLSSDANQAIDEFKQAYECKKEAKNQREEEDDKN